MHTSDPGRKALEQREGCVLHAYQDVRGIWTIGFGNTGVDVVPGLVWTQQQADDALTRRLRLEFEPAVNKVKIRLNQNEYDALVSFTYNVGVGGFLNSTMFRLLNAGDVDAAADQFDAWHVPADIIGRRNSEKSQFLGVATKIAPAPHAFTTQDVQHALGLRPDGVFGPATLHAVIIFQHAHNLTPDGIVGPKTLAALFPKEF